ncbi:MAG: HIRAN domain-containing protein [Zoogloeaceae bacterium]|jgi:hypothetical protein|nr:HIRAN domain-containing protein [Zoogloeaceae bacterium]
MRLTRIKRLLGLLTCCVALCAATALPAEETGRVRLLVQSSPLAGSQFHALEVWREKMRVGDVLTLVREPDNPYDAKAVRVEWQGHKLGYVPRRENRAVAAALDAGEALTARISRLRQDPDPWRRLEFEVWIEL